MATHRTEVRRDDGELIGFVEPEPAGSWRYLTVFGGELGTAADEGSAVAELHRLGLGVLLERWWFRGEPVTIVEASPGRVRVQVGGMALAIAPGRPDAHVTTELTGAELDELTLRRP
ncbi:MAG: hypothetical protein OJJ54_15315 [Pseudonocardia sp.]|nr:hypothetical protein [Pseudonocardia sp.]